VNFIEWQAFVTNVKLQWRLLWWNRFDDKEIAEGISDKDYSLLFVEKGTVILATRDFKMPDLHEILEQHKPAEAFYAVSPPPSVGGWRKFAKESVVQQKPRGQKRASSLEALEMRKPCGQQRKKGGRGWLHNF